jgi:hypothetical protein
MRKLTRKRFIIPLATVAVLAVAGIAVAFFTSSGTGSGTATVGSDNGVTISPVTITGTLYPDGPAATVDFTVNNGSADTAIHVDKVVADSITTDKPLCDASAFSFADVTVNADVPASGSKNGSGSLSMADNGANQDACKGATVTLNLKLAS